MKYETPKMPICSGSGSIFYTDDYVEPNKKEIEEPTNYDKSEEKELNLEEILKDHIGEMLFSPIIGNCNVSRISKEYICVTYLNNRSYCFGIDGRKEENGICMLYPSVESYYQHPLDADAAWQEFIEANKPKRWRAEKGDRYFFIDNDVIVWMREDDYSYTHNKRYKNGNYFRTESEAQQAAEAVRKCLDEFHEKNNQ